MKKGFVLLLILTGLFGVVLFTKAFSISPLKQIVTLEQGTGRVVKMKVLNTEKDITKYKISVLGVKQNEDGFPFYGVGIEEAESWVRGEQEFLEIASGKEVEASFVINVPKNQLPGSHYVGLSAEPVLIGGESKNFTGKLVSLLLIEVSGEVNESLSVLHWSGEKSFYLNLDKVRLNAILQNEGSAELPVKAKVRVYNWLNQKVSESDVFLGNSILPQAKRNTQVLLPQKSSWSLPGAYRAQLDIAYGRTAQKISAQYSFWYFPVSWLIIAGIIILLMVIALFKKINNKKRQLSF